MFLKYFIAIILSCSHIFKCDFIKLEEKEIQSGGEFLCLNNTIDCSNHGKCTTDKKDCICDNQYETFESFSIPKCNYRKKDQSIAILLELFGVGAGHFYYGNYIKGSIKASLACFLIFVAFFLTGFIIWFDEKFGNSKCLTSTIMFFIFLSVLATVAFYCYDIFFLFVGNIYDENGIKLNYWDL